VGTDNTGKNIYALAGGSRVFDCDGQVIFEMPLFKEAEAVVEFVDGNVQVYAESSKPYPSQIAEIHDALVFMIRENLKMFHISRMVIGASGGIDSAVSAALYAEAIGPENVFLVNMPTRFNSDTTKNAARDLAENLGTPYMVAPISDIIESICHTLERCSFVRNDTEMKVVGINHENLQARTRSASILSTVASIVGAGVTCNGNKSEAMVGYCTLYGDTCGVMCALGDLWKTQVYALARYINRDKEIIPKASIDIPASAELSEAMNVDEGKGDPILYPYHDKLFAMWVEKGVSLAYTEKLLMEGTLCETLGVDAVYFKSKLPTTEAALEDMRHWYRRFKGLALAKRIQFPPILSLSGHAFGGEYHESQV
jgi:NAD+ synthase (glutamine-hydrolysing)